MHTERNKLKINLREGGEGAPSFSSLQQKEKMRRLKTLVQFERTQGEINQTYRQLHSPRHVFFCTSVKRRTCFCLQKQRKPFQRLVLGKIFIVNTLHLLLLCPKQEKRMYKKIKKTTLFCSFIDIRNTLCFWTP